MAITYQFLCVECRYKEELYTGITRMEGRDKKPAIELVSCPHCRKLVGTRDERCPVCNLGVSKWFQFKKKGLKIIDTRMSPLIIGCPNCGNKNMKSMPILFSD